MFRGFARLLNNVHESQSSVLPYSITCIEIEQELLVNIKELVCTIPMFMSNEVILCVHVLQILLWKTLEENPYFMPFILKHCDITQLLIPICYFMLESRKDPAKLGLMYLCTFTLLKISGKINLNACNIHVLYVIISRKMIM